jgi:enoyl-CoA hydratase/carnithine racemase
MTILSEYQNRYERVKLSRDEHGILEMVLHTNGDSLRHGLATQFDLTGVFRDVALDQENRVVLITGTGEEFLGPRADQPTGTMGSMMAAGRTKADAAMWVDAFRYQREKVNAFLDIPVPVICAVNGPVRRHCETALLADVVIASETASFEDSAHFDLQDMVPGDGVHVIFQMLLGPNRARAFMLMGTLIDAQEALRLGLVAEVHPKERVLERAREVARRVASKSDPTLKFTRALFTEPIKKQMLEYLGSGLTYEALAWLGTGRGG